MCAQKPHENVDWKSHDFLINGFHHLNELFLKALLS